MKISQMTKRENFYEINKETLEKNLQETNIRNFFYIYPYLNAIVTKNPSKKVKDYLKCEYSLSNSNIIKKLFVKLYLFVCLNSFGLFASKKINLTRRISDEELIYPCNKKYRLFNFSKNTVDVFLKYGFSDVDLKNEILFRTSLDKPEFVPALIDIKTNGYTEKIIDGVPLPRMKQNADFLLKKAFLLMCDYRKEKTRLIDSNIYIESIISKIYVILDKCSYKCDVGRVKNIVHSLIKLHNEENIFVTFSHGDLQPGNIWIENKTNKIYIIDWESWGERSIWYDKAILFDGIRPYGMNHYFSKNINDFERKIVILEDLVFALNELNSLPRNYGSNTFNLYVDCLEKCMLEKRWI